MTISDDDRAKIVRLCRTQFKTHAEVARIMGVSRNSVSRIVKDDRESRER